jgi:integrase
LQPKDVDLGAGTITIRRQLYERASGTMETKLPKGGREATIPLAPFVVDALKRHLEARRSDGSRVPWLFTSERGAALRRSVFHRKVWHPFRAAHGLPYFVPHQLRHTTGTLLKKLGVRGEIVQEILRHASITTTNEWYQDEIPELQVDALERMSTALSKSTEKSTGATSH